LYFAQNDIDNNAETELPDMEQKDEDDDDDDDDEEEDDEEDEDDAKEEYIEMIPALGQKWLQFPYHRVLIATHTDTDDHEAAYENVVYRYISLFSSTSEAVNDNRTLVRITDSGVCDI